MALVAEYHDQENDTKEMIGVARFGKLHGKNEAEFSMIISDQYQKQGLGTELLTRLVEIGKDEKLDLITADILTENTIMRKVSEKVGFKISRTSDYGVMKARYYLNSDLIPFEEDYFKS